MSFYELSDVLPNLAPKTLIIMSGLPGSGKSTYVDDELAPKGFQVISPDSLRLAFGHAFYGPLEPLVHTLAMTMARALMLRGLPVVVDEAVSMASHVRKWKRLAEDMGYDITLLHLDTPMDVCKARRADSSGGRFPLDVIDRKAAQFAQDRADINALTPIITIH